MSLSKRVHEVKFCCINIKTPVDDEYGAELHSKIDPILVAEEGEDMDSSHYQFVTSDMKNPSYCEAESSLVFENQCKPESEDVSIFSHEKSSNKEQKIEPQKQCGLKDENRSDPQTGLLKPKSQIFKFFKPSPFFKVKFRSVFHKHCHLHSKSSTEEHIPKHNLKALLADGALSSVDHKEYELETKHSTKLQFVLSDTNNSTCFKIDPSTISHINQCEPKNENSSKIRSALSKANSPLFSNAKTDLADLKVCDLKNDNLSEQLLAVCKTQSSSNPETRCLTVKQFKQENENLSNDIMRKQLLDTNKCSSLNFDFNQKDIKECINKINAKYLVSKPMVGTDNFTTPYTPNDNLLNTTSHNAYQSLKCCEVVFSLSRMDLKNSTNSDCPLVWQQKKRKSPEQNDNSRFHFKRLKQEGHQYSTVRKDVIKSIENVFKTSITPSSDSQNKANTPKFPISVNITEKYLQRNEDTGDCQPLKTFIQDLTAATQPDYQNLNKQLISAISVIQNSKLSNSALDDWPKHLTNFASQSNSTMNPGIFNAQENGKEKEYPQYQDISFHIIKWNVAWLSLQDNNNEYPPIWGKTEIKTVKYTYRSVTDYIRTYYGLLLLSIWLNTYTLWKKKHYLANWELTSCEEGVDHYRNTCRSIVIPIGIPFKNSVILVACSRPNRPTQHLFGYVYKVEVIQRIPPSSKNRHNFMMDVILYFYTAKKLYTYITDTITILKLWQLKVATAQCAALCQTEFSSITNTVWDPKNNAEKIRVVHLPSDYWERLNVHVNKIIYSTVSLDNLFTLVQRLEGTETCLIILLLIRFYLGSGYTILVCLMDRKKFLNIANRLKYADTILAVQERVFYLPKNLKGKSLHACAYRLYNKRLDIAESEVLKKSKIILTMLPYLYLGSSKTSVLWPNLTCIIDDAHLCTEAETALPMSCNPKNVVMLGDYGKYVDAHPFLQRLNYHKSLFHRLFEYAQ